MEVKSKRTNFNTRKSIWKCRLPKGWYFFGQCVIVFMTLTLAMHSLYRCVHLGSDDVLINMCRWRCLVRWFRSFPLEFQNQVVGRLLSICFHYTMIATYLIAIKTYYAVVNSPIKEISASMCGIYCTTLRYSTVIEQLLLLYNCVQRRRGSGVNDEGE